MSIKESMHPFIHSFKDAGVRWKPSNCNDGNTDGNFWKSMSLRAFPVNRQTILCAPAGIPHESRRVPSVRPSACSPSERSVTSQKQNQTTTMTNILSRTHTYTHTHTLSVRTTMLDDNDEERQR